MIDTDLLLRTAGAQAILASGVRLFIRMPYGLDAAFIIQEADTTAVARWRQSLRNR
jgi:hypothetical protein